MPADRSPGLPDADRAAMCTAMDDAFERRQRALIAFVELAQTTSDASAAPAMADAWQRAKDAGEELAQLAERSRETSAG